MIRSPRSVAFRRLGKHTAYKCFSNSQGRDKELTAGVIAENLDLAPSQ